MASAFINLPETLRPWYLSGLRAIYRNVPIEWEPFFKDYVKPAKVVVTYFELGNDLSGRASVLRRQILKKILAQLGWPRGTVAYWPIAIPIRGKLEVFLDVFWQGVRMMNATSLICFGTTALSHLSATELQSCQPLLCGGLPCFVFPELEEFESMAPEVFLSTLTVFQGIDILS